MFEGWLGIGKEVPKIFGRVQRFARGRVGETTEYLVRRFVGRNDFGVGFTAG